VGTRSPRTCREAEEEAMTNLGPTLSIILEFAIVGLAFVAAMLVITVAVFGLFEALGLIDRWWRRTKETL